MNVIVGLKADPTILIDSKASSYKIMVEEIRKQMGFTMLHFLTFEKMIQAVIEALNNKNLKRENLCAYC